MKSDTKMFGYALAFITSVALLVLVVLFAANSIMQSKTVQPVNTWGPTAEFDTFDKLESGQDRWSLHGTDLDLGDPNATYYVLVDHKYGTEYLYVVSGGTTSVCPILTSDGVVETVSEAG